MLADFAAVSFVAFAVVVLPGWFWAKVLLGGGDVARSVAFSVALSMALVPVVALVPARLFGYGLTFAVAVAAPLVVFVAGIAAYSVFGSPKADDSPLVRMPRVPAGVPALGLMLAALLTVGFAMLGVVGIEVAMIPAAILTVFAGLVYLVMHRGTENASHHEDGGWQTFARVMLPVVMAAVLLRGYLGPVLYDWPFIRGVDHYSHAVMANGIIRSGEFGDYLIYPPGFHTMTAVIAQLSGVRPLEVFPFIAPAFPAVCALALYALGARIWGRPAGVVAAFVSGLVFNGAHWYMTDSMYPNLIAAQFLLVMTLTALVSLYSRPTRRGALLLALLGASVFVFHQVSSLYLALVLVPVSLFLLPYLFLRSRRTSAVLFSSLALMVVLSVAYVWDTYEFGALFLRVVGLSEGGGTGDAVDMAIGTQAPFTPDLLVGAVMSQPVAVIGLFGLLLLFVPFVTARNSGDHEQELVSRVVVLTVFFWTLVLFAGSLTSLSGFPQRFGRDLGVPLSLLCAPAVIVILRSLVARGAATVFVTSLVAITAAGVIGLQTVRNFEIAFESPVRFAGNYGLTITPEISEAGDWLRENNSGGNIMVSPQANQVPSRMMLAMGEYFAMQSYTEENLFYNRDLPPQGPEPLEDVLFAMYNPGEPRTQELLEQYDVRYIVHYKYMPDRGVLPFWSLTDNYPDLYRPVFENEHVVIVEPTGDDPASFG